MALVTVPLLFHVRLAPSTPAEILIVEPAAVTSVAAALASSVALPPQVKVPAAGMVMLLALVSVPPDKFRLVSVTGEAPRLVVPAVLVRLVSAVKAVPSLKVNVPSLLMLVRLAKALAWPELMPLKFSVTKLPATPSVLPTLPTAPVKLIVLVVQQPLLVRVEPLTL